MKGKFKLPALNINLNTINSTIETEESKTTKSNISGNSIFYNYRKKYSEFTVDAVNTEDKDKEKFSSLKDNKVNLIVKCLLSKNKIKIEKKASQFDIDINGLKLKNAKSRLLPSFSKDAETLKHVANNKVEFQLNPSITRFQLLKESKYINEINYLNLQDLYKRTNVIKINQ